MLNLLRVDLFKLRKSINFKISFLVSLICAGALALMAHSVAIGKINVSASSASGLSDVFIFSVLIPFVIGMLICGDFENKDIHDEISLGRGRIVIGKSIICVIAAFLVTLPYALIGLFCFISKSEFSQLFAYSTYLSIMSNVQGAQVTGATVGKAIAKVFVMGMIYTSIYSVGIPIAFKVRKPVIAIVIGEVFAFSSAFLIDLLHSIPGIDKLIELTPFYHMNLPVDVSGGDLVKYAIESVIFFVLMMGVSYLAFRKADIK